MMRASRNSLWKVWMHRIARQPELAEPGQVVQIRVRRDDVELEWHTTRQRLAPEESVIPAERWTESVRISSGRCVGPEVEGDIDRLAQTHLSTVHPERDSGVRSHQIPPPRPATTAPGTRPWSERNNTDRSRTCSRARSPSSVDPDSESPTMRGARAQPTRNPRALPCNTSTRRAHHEPPERPGSLLLGRPQQPRGRRCCFSSSPARSSSRSGPGGWP